MYNNSKANKNNKKKSPARGRKVVKMNEEVKPKKRTRVKPGYVRHPETVLIRTREALYLPTRPCYRDDVGRYHFTGGYVILREDWEDYHDFRFAPSEEAIQEGRFVARYVGGRIIEDATSMYIKVAKNDFLEVVKKHLEQ